MAATFIIPLIKCAFGRFLLQHRLLGTHMCIALTGKSRQQHPVAGLGIIVQLVLRTGLFSDIHNGTRMGHSCCHTHEDRQMNPLGIVVSESHHVVGFLLITRFQCGNHSKLPIETAVLLVLGRVHRGVVSHQHDQSTIRSRHG